MAPVNVIISGTPGRPIVNLLLSDVSQGVTLLSVTSAISHVLNLDPISYFLVMRGRLVSADPHFNPHSRFISAPGEATAFVTLTPRRALPGGKGGFGANLKGSAAASRPSSNFDACRDLNGRRIRTVRAESALNHLPPNPQVQAVSGPNWSAHTSSNAAERSFRQKRGRSDDSNCSHANSQLVPDEEHVGDQLNTVLNDGDAVIAISDTMNDISRGMTEAVAEAVGNASGTTSSHQTTPVASKRRRLSISPWPAASIPMALDGYSSSSSDSSSVSDAS